MTELVTYEKDESVAIITLDDGKANAVSHQLINELNAALDKAEEEKATVLLTGREGKFSAGFDLSVMKEGGPEAVGKLVGDGARLSQRLLAFPTPVIIACNGHSLAMGALMLLSVDYRIGVSGKYKVGLNEVAIGMTMPYFGFCVFFSEDLSTFSDDLRRAQPTVFFSVPRLWLKFHTLISQQLSPEQKALLEIESAEANGLRKAILAKLGLQETRVALTGSAPIAKDIVEWYRKLGLEMLDCYGMSENFATSHVSKPGQVRAGYVGSPAEGVEARISDSGELQVKSPGQMLGYFKSPEQTLLDMTEDGFFKTGDCGVIDHLERLKITGRVKDIFKTSKGKYIAPVPIEQKFNGVAEFESVCVMGSGFPQPFALVSLGAEDRQRYLDADLRRHFEMRVEKLLESINGSLLSHEMISFVVIADDIWSIGNGLLTPTMKIKRPLIENAYLNLAVEWFELNKQIIWQY